MILFKEISLFIEEILRLNKQLKLKTKNENYYRKKLEQYVLKEKQFISYQKSMENNQRTINLLNKTNEKFKTDIEIKKLIIIRMLIIVNQIIIIEL